ncbi:MAG TPA: tetratricopeptide repeat protein [Sphingobacterium sp.]|nr:tetratricopeptide repeat protein [Sphingobacterium sp.]
MWNFNNWFTGFIVGVSLLFASSVSAQDLQDKPYDNQLQTIKEFLQKGNLAKAIEGIDDILESYPDAAEVHYAKAMLFGQVNNINVALESAEKAYELDQKLDYAKYLLSLYRREDKNEALTFINKVVNDFPGNQDVLREKIALLHENKNSEEALTLLDSLKREYGDTDTLAILEAEVLADIGKANQAEKILKKFAKRNSKLTPVYTSYGFLLGKKEKYRQAVRVLKKGLKNTGEKGLYLDIADIYNQQNKTDQSFEYLTLALKSDEIEYPAKHRVVGSLLHGEHSFTNDQLYMLTDQLTSEYPEIAENYLFKGEVYLRKGDLKMAKSMFSKVIEMDKKHIEAWRMLINSELVTGDTKAAIQRGKEALTHNPNHPVLLYFTGLSFFAQKEYDSSRSYLEKALDYSEQSPDYLRSSIYSSLGDLYHAINLDDVSDVAYEEAIELDSMNTMALNNYAYYLSLREVNLDKAERFSRTSNEIDPNNSTFQDTYAWILYKQGEYENALSWIEKAIKNSSSLSPTVLEHYGDILYSLGDTKKALEQWQKALDLAEGGEMEELESKIKLKGHEL